MDSLEPSDDEGELDPTILALIGPKSISRRGDLSKLSAP
jgi:hypothetical protein